MVDNGTCYYFYSNYVLFHDFGAGDLIINNLDQYCRKQFSSFGQGKNDVGLNVGG